MSMYEFVFFTNLTALLSSIFSVGIMFLHRSSVLISNRRRNSAGSSYKAFLEVSAKTGAFSALILFSDALWGVQDTAFFPVIYWFTCIYVGYIIVSFFLFVTIGDFLSKVFLWSHSAFGRKQ